MVIGGVALLLTIPVPAGKTYARLYSMYATLTTLDKEENEDQQGMYMY